MNTVRIENLGWMNQLYFETHKELCTQCATAPAGADCMMEEELASIPDCPHCNDPIDLCSCYRGLVERGVDLAPKDSDRDYEEMRDRELAGFE